MEIGVQLYTLNKYCQTLEEFDETLKKVADIGYKNVQVSGTCEYEPQWLKEHLDSYGLKCVLTHIPDTKLLEDATKVAKDHDVFGCDCVGIGYWLHNEEHPTSEFITKFKPVADTLYENGKYFMYHNHSYEYQKVNGRVVMDIMAEAFPKDRLGFTLDTFWVQAGGGCPAEWLERLSGRVPCIHLKDYAVTGVKRLYAALGDGNINFDKVFAAAESAGTKYMLVEQDDCYEKDPFDCIKRSYDYLRSHGF